MEYQIEQQPLISVILPVRNNEEFLRECLESLGCQSYNNTEIIAIDDFSTDRSLSILNTFSQKDKRIKIFPNVKKYGLATTLNRAIRKSKGTFLAFMDPADILTKQKLARQLSFLKQNPKVVAVGTQCLFINAQGKRIGKSAFPQSNNHIAQNPLHGTSMLMEGIMVNRYKIPKDILHFSTKKHLFLYSDMAVKLMQYGQFANLPDFLHLHRKKQRMLSLKKQFFPLAKLWFSSRFQHGISLPLKPLFSQLFFSSNYPQF